MVVKTKTAPHRSGSTVVRLFIVLLLLLSWMMVVYSSSIGNGVHTLVHAFGYSVVLVADRETLPVAEDWSRILIEADEESRPWYIDVTCVALCVCLAALAAGLTLGLLGLDPLLLRIKERAGATAEERARAARLFPLVAHHHRLLVTLLLMNAIANEALPIFLEELVPPTVAILLSVTLVLFFGEIIPSAIFTGPSQMAIADRLVPVVKFFLTILYPIAGPIAAFLDHWLGHDHDDGFNRGELSALVRIQYEQRLASKRPKKSAGGGVPNNLDFVNQPPTQSIRASRRQFERWYGSDEPSSLPVSTTEQQPSRLERSPSLHLDEVTMLEGALQMKTKVAMDVYTPLRNVFMVPVDQPLNETNLVAIYAAGYTRVPVYVPNKKNDKTAVCGVLLTKQLIVVNPNTARPVHTLPLRPPVCVAPTTPLVHLLNLFQTGGSSVRGGHLALVCARPAIGNASWQQQTASSSNSEELYEQGLPAEAGLMGIITLEDVLEALLQEQIYDEMDKAEREKWRLAKLVARQWKRYVERRKRRREQQLEIDEDTDAQGAVGRVWGTVVRSAVAAASKNDEEVVTERTSLV